MRQGRETAIEAAMKRAGVDSDGALLFAIAADLLRKNGRDPSQALAGFVEELRDAGDGLMAALAKAVTEVAGLEYLRMVATDMCGDGIGARAPGVEGPVEMRRRRPVVDSPHPEVDDGSGHPGVASDGLMKQAAPSSSRSSDWKAGNSSSSSTISRSPPVAAPSGRPRSIADIRAIRTVATTIFDTHKLRDGTPIGDLRWSQIDRFVAANTYEAALLRLVRDYGRPDDPNARIRDVVGLKDMQRIFQKAAEEAHV
jgi:hypothetical protein